MCTKKLILALWVGLALPWIVGAQNSPAPEILNYGGSSLLGVGPDSSFCKFGQMTLAGRHFVRATGGETFDSLAVFLGAGLCVPDFLLSATQNGQTDTLRFDVPRSFMADTVLPLVVLKYTSFAGNVFTYSTGDSIALVGDFVTVEYADTAFCVGDTNPVPLVTLSDSTTGAFCCINGPAGFALGNDGAVLLNSGAVGENTSFAYVTADSLCPAHVELRVDVRAVVSAWATFGGSYSVTLCPKDGPIMADTLFPPGGSWAAPAGLALLDDSLGVIDPGGSTPGNYSLVYSVPGCVDPALVDVEILPVATASLHYPAVPLLANVPTLCRSDSTNYTPSFQMGASAGGFLVNPPGLALSPAGAISPWASQTGTYSISYFPPGGCVDTVLVLPGLVVDSVAVAAASLNTSQLCRGDTLRLSSWSAGGAVRVVDGSGGQMFSASVPGFAWVADTVGQFTLIFSTAGPCADSVFLSFMVSPSDDPAFYYPGSGNSPNQYCLNDPNPLPFFLGITGGTFSGSSVDPVTGRLDLLAAGPGQHPITYTTSGSCPADTTVNVTVFGSGSALFEYPVASICRSDTNPVPVVLGTPGGLFSAPPGLALDSLTGEIILPLSDTGLFTITYDVSGGCQSSFSQTIEIGDADTLTLLTFPADTFCPGGLAVPLLVGDSLGNFSASGGVVFENRSLGVVDLRLTAPGGPYVVRYEPSGRCSAPRLDTFVIAPRENPAFAYLASSFCQSGPDPLPQLLGTPGGVFSSDSITFTNSSNGQIDLGGSAVGGPFAVHYTTSGACPASSSGDVFILPPPGNLQITSLSGPGLCEGTTGDFLATADDAVNYAWFVGGVSKSANFNLLSVPLVRSDTIAVVAFNSVGCSDTARLPVSVRPAPKVGPFDSLLVLGGDTVVELEFPAVVDGTTLALSIASVGNANGWLSAHTSPVLDSGEVFRTMLQVRTGELRNAARLRVTVAPSGNGCEGVPETVTLEINPETRFWVAEVFTPNGDGQNDTWTIQVKDGIDVMDYEALVYNRAGVLVHRVWPLGSSWDGGSVPDGVYSWLVRSRNGGRVVDAGMVTMRRR